MIYCTKANSYCGTFLNTSLLFLIYFSFFEKEFSEIQRISNTVSGLTILYLACLFIKLSRLLNDEQYYLLKGVISIKNDS